ncbi:Hypothetical predicted protein [Scomber scombrus]|uniref:Secreted protein n=1 Tax=Scomber scombrus TaxID=13677 RepID=A0AAV1N715_SCOSC
MKVPLVLLLLLLLLQRLAPGCAFASSAVSLSVFHCGYREGRPGREEDTERIDAISSHIDKQRGSRGSAGGVGERWVNLFCSYVYVCVLEEDDGSRMPGGGKKKSSHAKNTLLLKYNVHVSFIIRTSVSPKHVWCHSIVAVPIGGLVLIVRTACNPAASPVHALGNTGFPLCSPRRNQQRRAPFRQKSTSLQPLRRLMTLVLISVEQVALRDSLHLSKIWRME